jgi:hypothetical protein
VSLSSFDPATPPAEYDPIREARRNTIEGVAGFFAAASVFTSLVALAYHPIPLIVASSLLALVASGMSVRHRILCAGALLLAAVCFVAGLSIAIVTGHSIW